MARTAPTWERQGFSSRRQSENSRARSAGFENYSQFQRLRKDPAYQALLKGLSDSTGQPLKDLRKMDSYINVRVANRGREIRRQGIIGFGGGASAGVAPIVGDLTRAFGTDEPEYYDADLVDWEEFRDMYEDIAG